MNDQNLMAAHRRGFIPGNAETEEAFQSRVEMQKKYGTYSLFDMQVDWVPVEIGKDIRFWEAGYTEIDVTGARIVLPKHLSSLVSFDELIKHELIHAIRCGFNESKYEELIAYQLSKRAYRRYFGPLFENRKIAWLFIVIAVLVITVSPYFTVGFVLPWLIFLPKNRHFRRAKKKIQQLFSEDPRILLLHFSDEDIEYFSCHSLQKCKQYFLENKSLRFKQLRLCYSLKD